MSRKVFFSFHYKNENDVTRAMVVRNSLITKGNEKASFINEAEFEKIKLKGKMAVES